MCTKPNGYGITWDRETKKTTYAHRFFYKQLVGEIPEGMFVCHKCDTPDCVNPEHLFLGTAKDNTQDMLSKNRFNPPDYPHEYGERASHAKLTQEQVENLCAIYKIGGKSQRQLAKEFGICQRHVGRLVRGLSWKNCSIEVVGHIRDNGKLSKEQVNEIRALYSRGGISYKRIAEIFNISKSQVHNIITYKSWSQ